MEDTNPDLQEMEEPPPNLPPKTYQWEDIRRKKREGAYPWTHLNKPPFDPNSTDDMKKDDNEYEPVGRMDPKMTPPIVTITAASQEDDTNGSSDSKAVPYLRIPKDDELIVSNEENEYELAISAGTATDRYFDSDGLETRSVTTRTDYGGGGVGSFKKKLKTKGQKLKRKFAVRKKDPTREEVEIRKYASQQTMETSRESVKNSPKILKIFRRNSSHILGKQNPNENDKSNLKEKLFGKFKKQNSNEESSSVESKNISKKLPFFRRKSSSFAAETLREEDSVNNNENVEEKPKKISRFHSPSRNFHFPKTDFHLPKFNKNKTTPRSEEAEKVSVKSTASRWKNPLENIHFGTYPRIFSKKNENKENKSIGKSTSNLEKSNIGEPIIREKKTECLSRYISLKSDDNESIEEMIRKTQYQEEGVETVETISISNDFENNDIRNSENNLSDNYLARNKWAIKSRSLTPTIFTNANISRSPSPPPNLDIDDDSSLNFEEITVEINPIPEKPKIHEMIKKSPEKLAQEISTPARFVKSTEEEFPTPTLRNKKKKKTKKENKYFEKENEKSSSRQYEQSYEENSQKSKDSKKYFEKETSGLYFPNRGNFEENLKNSNENTFFENEELIRNAMRENYQENLIFENIANRREILTNDDEMSVREFFEYEAALEADRNKMFYESEASRNALHDLDYRIIGDNYYHAYSSPPAKPPRTRSLQRPPCKKRFENRMKQQKCATPIYNTLPSRHPPEKPVRRKKRSERSESSFHFSERDICDASVNRNITHSKQLSTSVLPLMSNVAYDAETLPSCLRETSSMIHISHQEHPVPPKRKKNTSTNCSKVTINSGYPYKGQSEIDYERRVENNFQSPDYTPVRPSRKSSAATSYIDEDRTSRGLESLPSEASSAEDFPNDSPDYSHIGRSKSPRLSSPLDYRPTQTAPRKKSRRFSNFFTIPRIRSLNYIPPVDSHQRDKRCASPSRPPRRSKPSGKSSFQCEIIAMACIIDDRIPNKSIVDGVFKNQYPGTKSRESSIKSLTSNDVREKMKNRPLPSLPFTDKNNNLADYSVSKKLTKTLESENIRRTNGSPDGGNLITTKSLKIQNFSEATTREASTSKNIPSNRFRTNKRSSRQGSGESEIQMGDGTPEATLSELTCQIFSICQSSISKMVHNMLGQVLPENEEKRNEIQAAIWVITIIVAGCLMLGLTSEKTVHHHHWDFQFPPPK